MEANADEEAGSTLPVSAAALGGQFAGPAVEVIDLVKTYPGDVQAVCGISFDVSAGEVFGLLGPNGAGKSTTVGMLTTTIAPTEGTARLVGYDVAGQPRAARAASSVVFQEAVVDRALTGRRHLDLHARALAGRSTRGDPQDRRASSTCSTSLSWSTGPSGATAAASAGGWRSPERSSRAPACSFSTSRQSASTPASAPSCWT